MPIGNFSCIFTVKNPISNSTHFTVRGQIVHGNKELQGGFVKKFKILIVSILLPLVFISCGKNGQKIVTDIDVDQRIDQDKVYIDVEAKLDLGNTTLFPGKIPVSVPKKGLIGEVEVGTDFIKVSVLLSELVKLQVQDTVLPNGQRLPLISTNKVVVIPLDKSGKSFLYVSLVGGAKAIGFSLAIKELDKLGQELKSPTGFFPKVMIEDIAVYAGLYTSPNAGENGLGVFVDLNPIFKVLAYNGAWFEVHQGSSNAELDYSEVKPSSKKDKRMKGYLYNLHKQNSVLNISK